MVDAVLDMDDTVLASLERRVQELTMDNVRMQRIMARSVELLDKYSGRANSERTPEAHDACVIVMEIAADLLRLELVSERRNE